MSSTQKERVVKWQKVVPKLMRLSRNKRSMDKRKAPEIMVGLAVIS